MNEKYLKYCISNDTNSLEKLLSKTNTLSTDVLDNAIITAAKNGNIAIIRLLQKYGANPHCQKYTPINIAASNEQLETVRYLHSQMGESFLNESSTIIRSATSSGSYEIVYYLHTNGANLNDCIDLVPILNNNNSNSPLLKYFKEHGIDSNSASLSFLRNVLKNNNIGLMSLNNAAQQFLNDFIPRTDVDSVNTIKEFLSVSNSLSVDILDEAITLAAKYG